VHDEYTYPPAAGIPAADTGGASVGRSSKRIVDRRRKVAFLTLAAARVKVNRGE
jgi:hypothetical protein